MSDLSIDRQAPARIQRSRAMGWRMPLGAVSVTRPGPWGNPFPVSDLLPPAASVERFREWLADSTGEDFPEARRWMLANLHQLRGKTLACWCKEGSPCHAEVLLALANQPEAARREVEQ
jgi:hypothetical protein